MNKAISIHSGEMVVSEAEPEPDPLIPEPIWVRAGTLNVEHIERKRQQEVSVRRERDKRETEGRGRAGERRYKRTMGKEERN